MPPKKKSKSKSVAKHTAEAEATNAAVTSTAVDLTLTENGIDQLRTLSQHRPQRIAVGGFGVTAPGSQSVEPPRPNPVTLQIVQINRYFVDQRFWALVGVSYPVLPSVTPVLGASNNSSQQQQQMDIELDNGNGNNNARAPPAQSTPNIANPGFDAYSDLHVAYDLVVTDGRKQLKVLLSPTLAIHLEKGGLLPYGIIQVSEASMRYDETVVAGQGFLVLKQLRILAEKVADLRLADPSQALEYPAWVSASDMANKPLIGGPRSYYLSLFNDDTVYFDPSNYPAQGEAERIDKEQKQLMADVDAAVEEESKENTSGAKNRRKQRGGAVVPAPGSTLPFVMQDQVLEEPKTLTRGDVVTIKELLNRGMGYAHGDKSLVCRIFAKSRILNFGRKSALAGSSSKSELARSPFSFELLVGDESNEQIKVTLWNTLVGAYFHRLHIGQIVAIRGFRLKQARADNQFELALNPYNPIGSIRVLEGAYSVEQSVGEHIPPLTMTVSPIAVVKTMPDDSFFDVAGVVTYAGPMLREWSQPKKQFFQYRWIVIVDTSGMDAMSVKVWTNSQQSLLEEIVVSDVIYLSNLTIHSTQPASETNPSKRSIVATSTNYTQLLDVQAMQRTEHPYLLQLIKWSQQVNHADLAFYPSIYRWNLNFEQYKEMYTDMITPLRELPAVADALRFQQMKGVLVQAFLAEIIVHPAGLRPIADGVMSEQDYQIALRRLYPEASAAEGEKTQGEEKIQVIEESQASATPASTGKRSGRKGAAAAADTTATAVAASTQPDVEMVDATQATQVTRRSTRSAATQPEPQLTQTSRRGRRGAEADAETSDKSKSKGRRSKSASPVHSSSKKSKKGGRGAKSQKKGNRSASVGKAVKRGEQVVKTVAKKRKADRSPSPAAAAADTKAAEETAGASPAKVEAVTAEVPAPSLSTIVHPSAPSVLATLVLRDLNGESEFRVELHDPILGHVNFEQASGSLASTCQTPVEAPRALLGLTHLLPSSAFTPKEWEAFLHQACGTPAPVKGAKKQSPSAIIQAAVKQLHDALLQTLAPRRMLAAVQLTRFSYRQVESKISSVFQLDK